MLSEDLYLFQQRPFSNHSLRFLRESFASSYAWAVTEYGERPFLKVYRKTQTPQEVRFHDFAADVERTRRFLLREHADKQVIITVEGNTYEHLVYITAAILGGFCVAPMNPLEGEERLRSKITQIALPHALFRSPQLPMGAPLPNIEARPRHREDPMVLIFTSGTTGYSKIVQQTEQGILSNVDALIEMHGLSETKVIATPLPVFHVNALEFSFFCSLMSGQRLVLYEGFDFFTVLESLEKDRVQIFSVVPHILKSMTDLAKKILERPLVLEYCVTAASSLAPDLAKKLTTTFPFKIVQGYGLSEAVNFSLLLPPRLSKARLDHWLTDFARPSVGTPLRGNEVHVLDDHGQENGPDQEGEICVRGHNVMLGYKDQDNEGVFAGGYLHTGDLGFYKICEETGLKFFFISGRKKDVIKRFGLTISLVEVDDVLTKICPEGVTAIAVPFENTSAGEEIGVAINEHVTDEDLRRIVEHLQTQVSPSLRPHVIKRTSRKLRTESGKPQRWAQHDLFERYQKASFTDKILVEGDEP